MNDEEIYKSLFPGVMGLPKLKDISTDDPVRQLVEEEKQNPGTIKKLRNNRKKKGKNE